MNTLRQLNEWGASTIDTADARPSNLILDRTPPDVVLNIASTSVSVSLPFNIVEIINYTAADVQLQISIRSLSDPALTGATVSWASLPSGVNLNSADGVYTIDTITNPSQWLSLKNFTWNLPSDFANYDLWFIDAALLYTVDGDQRQFSWAIFDPRFYYVAQMEAISSILVDNSRLKLASAQITPVFRLISGAIPFEADLTVTTSIVVDGFLPVIARLQTTSTMVINAVKTATLTRELTSTASVIGSLDNIVSGMINRQYYQYNVRPLFTASNGGKALVFNFPGTLPNFALRVTSSIPAVVSIGGIGYDTIDAGISETDVRPDVSGRGINKTQYWDGLTISQINTKISELLFYQPTLPETYNSTITITLSQQASTSPFNYETIYSKTIQMTADSTMVPISGSYTLTNIFTRTWYPRFSESIYGAAEVQLVGGGGGGWRGNGGNGQSFSQLPIRNIPTSGVQYQVGAGGQGASFFNGQLNGSSVAGNETYFAIAETLEVVGGGPGSSTAGVAPNPTFTLHSSGTGQGGTGIGTAAIPQSGFYQIPNGTAGRIFLTIIPRTFNF